MAVNFNHTIVSARDSAKSAAFLAEISVPSRAEAVGPVFDGHDRQRRQHRFHGYGRKHHSATLRLSRQ